MQNWRGQARRLGRHEPRIDKGSLAIRVRDELGSLFTDEEFVDLFPVRGRPAWSPGRLALVPTLQFVEGFTNRQAAEAVRSRIDFKYAPGLQLDDPGFDFSVLSEFRDRLVEADVGRRVLDGILAAAREKGLLNTAGPSPSTHFSGLQNSPETVSVGGA